MHKIAAVNLHCNESEITGQQLNQDRQSFKLWFCLRSRRQGIPGIRANRNGAPNSTSIRRPHTGSTISISTAASNAGTTNVGTRPRTPTSWRPGRSGADVSYPAVESEWGRFNMHTEYVVSGSCADLIKLAMLRVSKAKLPCGARRAPNRPRRACLRRTGRNRGGIQAHHRGGNDRGVRRDVRNRDSRRGRGESLRQLGREIVTSWADGTVL